MELRVSFAGDKPGLLLEGQLLGALTELRMVVVALEILEGVFLKHYGSYH